MRIRTLLLLTAFIAAGVVAQTPTILEGDITTDQTLSSGTFYLLRGFVNVKAPATLTIQPGTVIMGEKATKGTLIINRGAKIDANGTANQPIIFTSAEPQGSRATGDWGGVIICGNAAINVPGGVATIEGGVTDASNNPVQYGGGASPNDDDSSGVFRYVRIEYPGIAFQPNSEINGLTLGAVGRKTLLERVQVSYSGDDGFEFFGGTVDGRYLISYASLDDDFDTDFGYRGRLQFVVALRDPAVADISGSHAMEADNDGTGTFNAPRSNPTISNATFVGPMPDTNATGWNPNYRRGGHWRRSTQYGLYNSVIIGWPDALLLDGSGVVNGALGDTVQLRNNLFAGNKGGFKTNVGSFNATAWATTSSYANTVLGQPSAAQLTDPFNLTQPVLLPIVGSPALSGADFSNTRLSPTFFTATTYRGAFNSIDRWDLPWANYNPQQTVTSVEKDAQSVPTSVELGQNYPNPFNPSTVIRFSLPNAGQVSVRVFDVLGREVSTLVNGFVNAGTHTAVFEGRGLSSGIYFYVLQAGSVREVKRMTLMK